MAGKVAAMLEADRGSRRTDEHGKGGGEADRPDDQQGVFHGLIS